jgi:hypothetical protein
MRFSAGTNTVGANKIVEKSVFLVYIVKSVFLVYIVILTAIV